MNKKRYKSSPIPIKIKIGMGISIAAVCIAVLATHWPTLSARALSFDDYQYLIENVLVQNPSWESTRRFLTEVLAPSTVGGYYQPLAMISLMLDCTLGGSADNLRQFHNTGLALHIINTALIIVLLYLLFGRIWTAAAAGLLFGVHPMTVEAVTWIGERKTLLAASFSLWSLIFYASYVHKNKKAFYAGSLAAYILALMSKPTSTPLPLVMLLMDYWPLRRKSNGSTGFDTSTSLSAGKLTTSLLTTGIKYQISKLKNCINCILEKIPFFAVGGVSAVITYISQSQTVGTLERGVYGPLRVPLILCHNIVFYLYKIVWPVNLSSHYAFPESLGISNPMVLAGVIGTFVLIILLAVSLRRTRGALSGWLIFFAAILPTMQIVGFSDVIASDKFAYLPSIGLLMALAAFLGRLCNIGNTARCAAVTMILLALAGSEAIATRRYLAHWKDTVSLSKHMLKFTPNAAPVHDMLGVALLNEGRFRDAADHFQIALQTRPDFFTSHNNLGNALQSQGKLEDAIGHYRKALQLNPGYAKAHYNLGMAVVEQGKWDEAAEQFCLALKSKPDYAEAHNNLGNVLQLQGKNNEAIVHFRRALEIKQGFVEAHNNLANALQALGRFDEAISCYRRALQIEPNLAQIHYNLGVALSEQGRIDEAISCYRRALVLADTEENEELVRRISEKLERYKQSKPK